MQHPKLSKFYEKRPDLYQQHRHKYNHKIAVYSLLSTEPPIFYVPSTLKTVELASLNPIFNYLQDRTAYFLQNWWWDMENPQDVEAAKSIEIQHIRQFPKHKFIHLCNTPYQKELFCEHGLNAVFCNQNCLVDENIYKPIASISKVFDAVYDAKLSSYKRHSLARKIDSIALIYYDILEDIPNQREVISLFSHAHFFNNALSGKYQILSPSAVNQCLNACKVGLCLSSVEGAMYASIQYLLSGLPVVSTTSKGGRDIFFDEEYALIVEEDPDAVKEGIDELIRRNIPAERTRSKVLEKMKQHRLTLIALIQDIYNQEGVERNFSEEWDLIFHDKLFKYQGIDLAIEKLELAKQGVDSINLIK